MSTELKQLRALDSDRFLAQSLQPSGRMVINVDCESFAPPEYWFVSMSCRRQLRDVSATQTDIAIDSHSDTCPSVAFELPLNSQLRMDVLAKCPCCPHLT